jgi:hypothetical protein
VVVASCGGVGGGGLVGRLRVVVEVGVVWQGVVGGGRVGVSGG